MWPLLERKGQSGELVSGWLKFLTLIPIRVFGVKGMSITGKRPSFPCRQRQPAPRQPRLSQLL